MVGRIQRAKLRRMAWSWSNIDWEATAEPLAAWAQAVGTVIAIGWTVWIAYRAEQNAGAQTQARNREIVTARRAAILTAASVFDLAGDEMLILPTGNASAVWLTPATASRMRAALTAIDYFLAAPEAMTGALVEALTLAQQRIRSAPRSDTHATNDVDCRYYSEAYREAAADLRQIIADYDSRLTTPT